MYHLRLIFYCSTIAYSVLAAPTADQRTARTQVMHHAARDIPPNLPTVITPAGGPPDQPADTTLIQLGFTHSLNWPFVVDHPTSQSQIFTYTPSCIAYGLGIDEGDVNMQQLQADDTSESLGYITTLAKVYLPNELVNELALEVQTPNSAFYDNPDSAFCGLVNPAIPITQ